MKKITGYIYDRMLYVYCYVDICLNQRLEELEDFKKNASWVKKNGRYDGRKDK